MTPSRLDGLDERPAGARRGRPRDELERAPSRAEPARGRSPPSRPGQRDPAGHVGAALERRAGASTTSSTRSPSTTIRAGPAPDAARCGAGRARSLGRRVDGSAGMPGGYRGRRYNDRGEEPAARPHPTRSGARPMTVATDLDRLAIDTIRTLSIDGVQKANSGHPGRADGRRADGLRALDALPAPRADAPRLARPRPVRAVAPATPAMLLYSLLHLTGYDLSLDDLQQFRQWGSHHAGPPGVRPDAGRRGDDRAARPGLRQRGRAWRSPSGASPHEFNRPGHDDRRPPDLRHRLRRRPPGGHRLGGRQPRRPPPARASSSSSTTTTTSSSTGRRRWPGREDVPERFEAYGWHTQRVEDGNDLEAIEARDRGRARTTSRRA